MTNQNKIIRQTAAGLLAFNLIAGLLPGFAAACRAQVPAGQDIPQLPELNWEQRSDWLNVKTGMAGIGPAAVGDGKADDTAALQAAFDMVQVNKESPFSAVYFPPGTYRITREIRLGYPKRLPHREIGYLTVNIYGHGRSTRILWDGPEGGTMCASAGVSYSRFVGVAWDGRGKAARGFVHDGGNDTKVLHEHEAFVNFTEQGSGTTKGPRIADGYLEGSMWRNCLFVKCGKALPFWQFNDYVMTIDGCDFSDCGYGVWAERGDFYVRNCHFERSTQCDIMIANDCNGCSARRSTSVGSRAFYECGGSEGTPFTMQDCHVSGWTNPGYAVNSKGFSRGPMLIFDCTFTDAPSADPPIRLDREMPVVHSNNRTSAGTLFGGKTQLVKEVPKGERGGSITSARQSFFRSEVAIPTKVFDAKRDFGARGDGRTDDTGAVQACIDAAREYGRGAIAYLPRGNYRLDKTIHITGGNYYVGGANRHTSLGNADILVTDPRNVTLENLHLQGGAIRQVSTTGLPSRMDYEHLYYMKSFEMVGLSKDSVVTISTCASPILIDNCSSARILINYHDDGLAGRLTVKGTQADRSGFLGVLASQIQFLIEDNQSLVGGDCYQEQMGRVEIGRDHPFATLRGSATLPAGRVTIGSPKICGTGTQGRGGIPFEEYFKVEDFRGRLSHVMAPYWNHTPNYDPGKKAFKTVCSGEAPLDILWMGNSYCLVKPSIEGSNPNVTRTVLGCWFSMAHSGPLREPLPDVLHANSMQLASKALDDFRELGEQDLALNYGDR